MIASPSSSHEESENLGGRRLPLRRCLCCRCYDQTAAGKKMRTKAVNRLTNSHVQVDLDAQEKAQMSRAREREITSILWTRASPLFAQYARLRPGLRRPAC